MDVDGTNQPEPDEFTSLITYNLLSIDLPTIGARNTLRNSVQ
jgi:hypothetical protein